MTRPILQAKKLFKTYSTSSKEVLALSGVSLDIQEQDIFGIIGLSGAGKSTLLKILSGAEDPTEGELFFCGESVQKNPKIRHKLQKNSGFIFQHFQLLSSRNAIENVMLPLEFRGVGKKERQQKALALLTEVGLAHRTHSPISHLSGGEKQRVAVARALSLEPDILFCDEATSALDPRSTKDILQLLKNLHKHKKMTLVLITHEMEAIKQICQKVAVMDNGCIVEQGAVDDVLVAPGHPITKKLIDSVNHDLPPFLATAENMYRLRFRGATAKDPLMARVIQETGVSINVLSGWIDSIENLTFGTLVIQIQASENQKQVALQKLVQYGVLVEPLT